MNKVGQLLDRFSFFDGLEMEPVTQVNWSDYWRGVIPDGVVAEVGEEMRPYANSTGMYVYVSTGACIVDNHRGVNSALKIMPVNTADATYDRIDLLVARVVYGNENESYMELDILTGTPAIDPVAPTLTQSTGDVYEIALAEIHVAAEAVTLEASTVADLRNVFTAASQSISFINDDEVDLTKGMLVWLSRDNEGAVKRCPVGKMPIGVVTSDSIPVGSRGQVATAPGTIEEICCGSGNVSIGDELIPSETAGIAKAGGGFGGGLALEAKESGAVGNVKSLLTVFSKIPFQNGWWMLDGIEEEDVIAAYQFISRPTEAEALINMNNGETYTLEQSESVTWQAQSGFIIPAAWSAGLWNNTLINLVNTSCISAGFGFTNADAATATGASGGIIISNNKLLAIRGWGMRLGDSGTINNLPQVAYSGDTKIHNHATQYTEGVFSASWNTLNMYIDGTLKSVNTGNTLYADSFGNPRIIGQPKASLSSNLCLPFTATAVVFYNVVLTAEQHLELANNIRALGGMS